MTMLKYAIVYSPDDGGYYADIWDTATGSTVKQTRLVKAEQKAKDAAIEFIKKQNKKDAPNA